MEYLELLSKIMYSGVDVRDTKEIMDVDISVNEFCLYDIPNVRNFSITRRYMLEEIAWYMSGDRDHTEIAKSAELWRKIKNEDGTLNSNYGFLVFYNETPHPSLKVRTLPPFEWAARALEADKESRQGMVTYNTGGFNYVGNKDYICSQHQAFYIRNHKLHCYITKRSSDAIYGLTYNMPWWQLVYQQMYLRLLQTYPDLQEVPIKVRIYSEHIYEKHFSLVENMLRAPRIERIKFQVVKQIPLSMSMQWYRDNLHKYVSDNAC